MKSRQMIVGPLAIIALLTGVLVTMEAAQAAPESHGSTWQAAVVPLPNGAVGYDHVRDKVLVAVSPSSPALGNHLVEMDPHTGELGRSVAVGANPWSLAVSDDASRAYIGLGGAPMVTEIDLATFTVVRSIYLGTAGFSGAFFAEDIAVQPGEAEVIAVSRRNLCCSPRHEGVAIYDNGVKRPIETSDSPATDRITWSDDPGVIYGSNNSSTPGFGFMKLAVNEDGVSITEARSGVISAYATDIEFAEGLVHAASGQVVDPVSMSLVGSYSSSGPVEVDETQHKTFIQSGTTLRRYDVTTRLADWSVTVPNVSARDLVDAEDVMVAAGDSSIALLGPGVSSIGFELPDPPETFVQVWAAHGYDLAVAELASSVNGTHVYGVVRSSASSHPNELVEVDTESGEVVRSVLVGADPHRIAISDDGSTIMVGHDDANLLTEVDVATFDITRTVTLGSGKFASDIVARPGMPHSFAVIVGGTFLVENGVMAENFGTGVTSIAFAGDPTRLYGHNGGHTGFEFYTYEVSESGINNLGSYGRLIGGFKVELVSSDGLIFASTGGVADPLLPVRIGSYSSSGQPVPIPSENRMLFVSGSTINEFELDTYVPVKTHSFGSDSTIDAVLAGDQVAIATSSQIVFVPLGADTRRAPDAPSDVLATAANGQATISWVPSADDGGSPITDYTAAADPGGQSCSTSGTSCVVEGLTNGTSYVFTVTATNVKGTSPASSPSNVATPIGPPSAPTGLTATAGAGEVQLAWTVPASSGGSPVIAMTAVASPGGASCSTDGTSCSVAGLVNGLEYTFTVSATNAVGTGPPSPATDPVVPTACDGEGGGPFPDVDATHTFCSDIEWLIAHGITSGYSDGLFHPTFALSRQAIASFGYRYQGQPDFDLPVVPTFRDVPPEHLFFVEIEWLVDERLASGYADGSFRPNTVLTRQSLAVILNRLGESWGFLPPITPSFTDVPLTHPYFEEIEWLVAMGAVSGFEDGTFRPEAPVSRQALATFFHRFATIDDNLN